MLVLRAGDVFLDLTETERRSSAEDGDGVPPVTEFRRRLRSTRIRGGNHWSQRELSQLATDSTGNGLSLMVGLKRGLGAGFMKECGAWSGQSGAACG